MTVIKTFHSETEKERRMRQRPIAHGTAVVQRGDQRRLTKVGQYSKPKHVSFEDVEHETEKYDRIDRKSVV